MIRAVVIEDSPTQLAHLRLLLERNGFEVFAATGGAEGLALCAEILPDIVVTDVVMPELDGFEVTRRLKSDERTAKIPVVVATTLDDPRDVLAAIDAGADNYLIKPYVESDLVGRLRRTVADPVERLVTVNRATASVLVSCLEDLTRRNREMRRKSEELASSNAQRDELMRVVAHELRGPLQSLAMRADVAKNLPPEKSRIEELPHAIETQVRTMVRIIDDLSDLTALDLGTMRLNAVEQDLVAMLQPVVREAAVRYPGRTIEFEPEASCTVSADPDRIGQVLSNFLSNADKYSDAGLPIRVGTERTELGVRIRVDDQGVGIDDAERDRVFERYYRVEASVSRAKGVGLGLHICRRIIDLHRGRIGVDPRVGGGSSFWFELPVLG